MKSFISFAILLAMLTACTQFSEPSMSKLPLSTMPTSFIGQVSIENAQVIYYDITGSTANELRQSMNQLRPKDPYDGDKPVDAYTDWYISWNWPGYGTADCDLSQVIVEYEIKVILPRWKPPADASPALIKKWNKYIQSVALHEKGHVDHIVKNYPGVKNAIQGANCATAEIAAQKVLDSLREFDRNYDKETRHGETQGAIFR